MMRRGPALTLFVPLEHGKIRYPEESKIYGGIAALLESTMPFGIFLSQSETQQPRSGINRMIVLLDLRLHAAFGFVLCRLTISGDDHDQVVSFSSDRLANLGRSFRKVFLQPLEVFKQLCSAFCREQRLDLVAILPRKF